MFLQHKTNFHRKAQTTTITKTPHQLHRLSINPNHITPRTTPRPLINSIAILILIGPRLVTDLSWFSLSRTLFKKLRDKEHCQSKYFLSLLLMPTTMKGDFGTENTGKRVLAEFWLGIWYFVWVEERVSWTDLINVLWFLVAIGLGKEIRFSMGRGWV